MEDYKIAAEAERIRRAEISFAVDEALKKAEIDKNAAIHSTVEESERTKKENEELRKESERTKKENEELRKESERTKKESGRDKKAKMNSALKENADKTRKKMDQGIVQN